MVSWTASAADPLVTVDWVKANLGKPGIVFLDLRPKTDYLRGHVPGAVDTSFDSDGWRVPNAAGIPDQFPEDQTRLAKTIGGLGIGDRTLVVVLPPGQSAPDMGMGTRIYWTLKVLGHDAVSLLDGGMAAYVKAGGTMAPGQVTPAVETFAVKLRKDMLITKAEVRAALDAKVPMVDGRPDDQYVGVNRNSKVKASGTIPGARSLPLVWYTENGGGTFRARDQIEKLYQAAGVSPTGKAIYFCNTGHMASVGWFYDHEVLGNRDALLYSGSLVDWTADASMPVEQKVKF